MNTDFQLMRKLILHRGTWRKRSGADEWQAALNQGRSDKDRDFSLVVALGCFALIVVISYLVVIFSH